MLCGFQEQKNNARRAQILSTRAVSSTGDFVYPCGLLHASTNSAATAALTFDVAVDERADVVAVVVVHRLHRELGVAVAEDPDVDVGARVVEAEAGETVA